MKVFQYYVRPLLFLAASVALRISRRICRNVICAEAKLRDFLGDLIWSDQLGFVNDGCGHGFFVIRDELDPAYKIQIGLQLSPQVSQTLQWLQVFGVAMTTVSFFCAKALEDNSNTMKNRTFFNL